MSGTAAEFEGIKQAAMVRLPGADMALLDMEAKWVLHEFTRDSRVWRRVFPIVLLPDLIDYPLSLEVGESAVVLLAAHINGTPVRHGLPLPGTGHGYPMCVGMPNDRMVRVFPIPSPEQTGVIMQVSVALTLIPTVPGPVTMPDELRPYHSYLVDGMLARMFSMPDKAWSNRTAAEPHMRRFMAGINMVRREMDAGRTYGSITMRGPRFGR